MTTKRTAKQRAASIENLKKARRARSSSTSDVMMSYHWTKPQNAAYITGAKKSRVRKQGFSTAFRVFTTNNPKGTNNA